MSAPDDDARFTFGLLYDTAKTLEAHGYPMPTGDDLVELQQALLRFLYARPEKTP
jgi:hypothetical protein